MLFIREYYGVGVGLPDFSSDYFYDDYDYLGLGGLLARQVKKEENENLDTKETEGNFGDYDYEDFGSTDHGEININ